MEPKKTNPKYQRIEILIPQASASVPFAIDTDKMYDEVTGISVSLPEDNSFFGSTVQMKINGEEIFQEGHEVKFLGVKTLHDVSPNHLFYSGTKSHPLREKAKGSRVEGKFTDGGFAVIQYPYVAQIYLRLENVVE